ncbi:hypothetical protein DB32_000301 [Sandaracinus amylolyticus]|uniref:Uncharacterized protein n=1 Tax=Sandaracinus amylolyticus TaxID=927083 RepID=A0A0F6VZ49_9BACT|nr:hypothetical protein DB32_000301 [Sandaracinus amylolyticus]
MRSCAAPRHRRLRSSCSGTVAAPRRGRRSAGSGPDRDRRARLRVEQDALGRDYAGAQNAAMAASTFERSTLRLPERPVRVGETRCSCRARSPVGACLARAPRRTHGLIEVDHAALPRSRGRRARRSARALHGVHRRR